MRRMKSRAASTMPTTPTRPCRTTVSVEHQQRPHRRPGQRRCAKCRLAHVPRDDRSSAASPAMDRQQRRAAPAPRPPSGHGRRPPAAAAARAARGRAGDSPWPRYRRRTAPGCDPGPRAPRRIDASCRPRRRLRRTQRSIAPSMASARTMASTAVSEMASAPRRQQHPAAQKLQRLAWVGLQRAVHEVVSEPIIQTTPAPARAGPRRGRRISATSVRRAWYGHDDSAACPRRPGRPPSAARRRARCR